MAKKDSVNVGVIGVGGIGWCHMDGYKKHPGCKPVAICDINKVRLEEIAKQFGIPQDNCFTDYRKMLRSAKDLGMEAVSVCLPNVLHAPVTIAALQAGMHVLCEKPMSTNAADAKRMLQTSRAKRRKLMINFSYRFHQQSQALKRFVDTGAIGDIYFGRSIWHRRRGLPGLGGWFGIKEQSGGGPIIDLGVHRLDLAMWLMGNPRPVTVSGSTYSKIGPRVAKEQGKKFNVEDLGCGMIKFANGATIMLEASWAGYVGKAEEMSTQLWGTKGGLIQGNVGEGYDFDARVFTESNQTLWEGRLQQCLGATFVSYHEFVNAILEDREPIATGQHGLDVQQILDAIYKSAQTGREVRIG